jgi:pimeloyl-ACP methyl ester carboxylesterase
MKKMGLLIMVIVIAAIAGYSYNPIIDTNTVLETYRYPESKLMNINGLNVHYYEKGEGDETLIFLHGNGANTRHYDELINSLSKHYRIIIMDYLGHGLTGSINNDFSNQAFIQFFENFINRLGLTKFHLAGHSMGGYWSLLYAQRNPNNVDKIILVSPYGGICSKRTYGTPFMPEQLPFAETLTQYFFPRVMVEKTLKDYVYNPSSISEELIDIHFGLMSIKNSRAYRKYFFSYKHPRMAIDSTKLDHDIYLLAAENDAIHNLCEIENLQRRLAIKQTIILEKTGHLAATEKPKETAAALLQFLRDRYKQEKPTNN